MIHKTLISPAVINPFESLIAMDVETGLSPQSVPPTKIAGFGIPLYPYPAIPPFLQGNPNITDGYRAHLSPKLCVKRYVYYISLK